MDNLSTVKELPIIDDYIYDIDWNRGEFLSLNVEKEQLCIRDLETGEMKHHVAISYFSGFWEYNTVYLNDRTLFIGDIKLRMDYL